MRGKKGGRRRGKLKNSDAGMVTHTKEEEEEGAGDIISQKRGKGGGGKDSHVQHWWAKAEETVSWD